MELTPNLWFDDQAEEAATFYTGIFPNSKILRTTYYPEAAQEVSGKRPGSVLTVEFELDGQKFVALNGGPDFKFSEAISFMIPCKDQKEIDYYWDRLTDGGEESMCGWLKDRFGLSWQIVPVALPKLLFASDRAAAGRAMQAMLRMRKIDIAALEAAFRGKP
jgi:predicted 3-demethylubiquinone-9 3-methyltransferase (glyoxalase superfamily)